MRRERHRRDPAAVGDLVGRLTRRLGGSPPARGGLSRLAAAWPGAVGPQAAGASLPVRRTRAGVVSVACADAAWAHELRARQELILARLAELAPEERVAGLRFVVADHALPPPPGAAATGPAAPAPAPRAAPRPTPAQSTAAAGLVAGIEDPEIRALAARAAAAGLARAARPGGGPRAEGDRPR
ncbi:MAG: DUF721 domain-containing protein [Thermoleophilia bacterium]|nr:DUF721 domain-containing protein [Thermoleophilia bacterium]